MTATGERIFALVLTAKELYYLRIADKLDKLYARSKRGP